MKTSCAKFIVLLMSLPALVMAGDVQAYSVKGVDLSAYKTYKLLPVRVLTGHGVIENEPEVSPFIVAALRKQLAQKGLTESETADMEVSAGGLAVSIPQIEGFLFSPLSTVTWDSQITTIGRYNKEGTLIVNLIDARTNKSIWLGVAKRALGRPSKLSTDIDKAANAMFKKYPSK